MRRLLALPVFAATLLLAGCIIVPAPDGGGDRTDDDRIDIPTPGCDGPALLSSPNTHYDLGHCDEVIVEGAGISVEASDIGTLTIRGDGVEVDAASIGVIEMAGQDDSISATGSIGSIDIEGDRNEVDADGDVGAVVIAGNDNEVTGQAIGSSTVNGDRNVVSDGGEHAHPHHEPQRALPVWEATTAEAARHASSSCRACDRSRSQSNTAGGARPDTTSPASTPLA